MQRWMLVGLNVMCSNTADKLIAEVTGWLRNATNVIKGYTLNLGFEDWILERGEFIQQVDAFSCGPIACKKQLAYDTSTICTHVTNKWQQLVAGCNNYLRMHVREHLLLLEPCPDGDTFNVPSNVPIWMLQLWQLLLFLLTLSRQVWIFASAA
jgi:hypothetical protein